MATCESTPVPGLLYQISRFVLPVTIPTSKVLKYYDRDCSNFFLLITLPMMIQISRQRAHFCSKKFFKKQPIRKVGSFLVSSFDLNQIYKIVLTQSIKLGSWRQLICFIFCFKVTENAKKCKFEGDWAKFLAKYLFVHPILDETCGTK